MKTLLPLILICLTCLVSSAQITVPAVRANFGVDGELITNIYKTATTLGSDDWYSKSIKIPGKGVIDTTGAAQIVTNYTTQPSTRMSSFSRAMSVDPYSAISGRLLLDAVFSRDFHGDDSTVFASGSNKNGMSPANWTCPVSQGVPDKNDILDAYTHVRRDGLNVTDSLWMFGGISIENTTGSRYFDFELYQTDFSFNRSTLSFQGYGPSAGHTAWTFDATGKIVSPGDIIFTAEYSGTGLSLIEARIWIDKSNLLITPTNFQWGGAFDGASAGATYGYANILPKTAGDFYTGTLSVTDTTWAGPFSLIRANNSLMSTYDHDQFLEFSVNLTKLGIEPSTFSNNSCGSPFRRVFIKTRSSSSFSSELKDFVAPYRLFNYAPVDADTYYTYYCGSMPDSVPIKVINPLSTSLYQWSTGNGQIVGSTTGPSIVVNAPGTYYVTQQLNSQCPVFAQDSVRILYTASCTILALKTPVLSSAGEGEKAGYLKWQVNNNELITRFKIEVSSDNRNFSELSALNSTDISGDAEYSYRSKNGLINGSFYRIKVIGKTGETVYSNTLFFRTKTWHESEPMLFPNPVVNETWISYDSPLKQLVTAAVVDASGQLVKTFEVPVSRGPNLIPVSLANATSKPGIYLLRLHTNNRNFIQKFILKR